MNGRFQLAQPTFRAIALLACCCAVAMARADVATSTPCESTPCPAQPCRSDRDCDTVWIVNTRAAGCGNPQSHVGAITFQARDVNGRWQPADLQAFLATDDPAITTLIYIHGNRYSTADVYQEGMQTYRALVNCRDCSQPVRFVIFSWPSSRIKGPLNDVRTKAARTNVQGFYLAWLIDQIGADVPVSVMGYSFGARVATGGLHLLGGGSMNGWTLDRVHPQRQPMNVVLAAAALDNHWLIPGHRHGRAMSQVSKLTVIYNACDTVLEHYRFLYGRKSGAVAMGYTGLVGRNRMGADAAKISQLSVTSAVGKTHTWSDYLRTSIMTCMCRALLPREGFGVQGSGVSLETETASLPVPPEP